MKSYARRFSKRRNPAGFTIIEIVIVVIVVAVLLALASVYYYKVVIKGEDTEALVNLKAIRDAEFAQKAISGSYLNATNTTEINEKLDMAEIADKIFTYKVVNVTAENFIALAERVKPDMVGEKKPIVIAMYSDGSTGYAFSSSASSVSSGLGGLMGGGLGGWSGGSSGGSGGGSSGGGSGGSSGGSSGSGTGGSSGGQSGTGGSTPVVPASVVMQNSLDLMKSSASGAYYRQLIEDRAIICAFNDLGSGILGQWIPSWWIDFFPDTPYTMNTIYVSSSVESVWSIQEIATVMVHEALHADYTWNTEKWVEETTERLGVDANELNWYYDFVTGEWVLGDSIDQEYNAFCAQLAFWKEVKGAVSNYTFDQLLTLYEVDQALGTDYLYATVASWYQGYPPYLRELPS